VLILLASRLRLMRRLSDLAQLASRYALGHAVKRTIWLTFDDGPHPEYTPRILEALNSRSIGATFFVVGERAEKHLGIVEAAFRAGHRIGNHSFTHQNLTKLDRSRVHQEIERTDKIIGPFASGGRLFRPPYGARNAMVDEVASELGYQTVLWTASTRDWHSRYQPDGWVGQGVMMIRLSIRSSVLLHDNLSETSLNIGRFLDAVQAVGNVQFMNPASLTGGLLERRRGVTRHAPV
jgi:peptidoglycan/xylan/chitin deacetylase (PgdA/CDA1 family)